MSKAKQAKQEQEVVNQIVLTEKQFSLLCEILSEIDNSTDQIAELVLKDYNQIQLGYNLGMINNDLQRVYNKLDGLTDDIGPSIGFMLDDEDDDN